MEKIKVVWLCHFSNAEIQSQLKPFKKLNEYAPWISNTLKVLEGNSLFEVYVISPHEYIRGIHKFTIRGIHYFFYNAHMPFIGRHWPGFFKWDYISNFFTNKLITKYLVNKIKPDVIHLHGAENAYYSSTILQFIHKYPCILMIQGFISHSSHAITKIGFKRISYEKRIIATIPNAFYRTQQMVEELKTINPSIQLFKSIYPYTFTHIQSENIEKKYDIVFFARVTKDKGIGDLLEALAILKKCQTDISLCVIGNGELDKYKQYANSLGLTENVYWAGFLPTQQEVHRLVVQAKISVLPTYHDIMPGGVVEAMMLGVSVISYNLENNQEINEKEEVISLVEKGDVAALAKAIEELLSNKNLSKERSEKGIRRANEMFAYKDEEVRLSLLEGYRQAIEIFQEKKKNKKEKKA